jgi:hypothetical protein
MSNSTTIDSGRLFRRLHEPGASHEEIIDVLGSHKHLLKPEDIINHALKLDPDYAIQLLKLVENSDKPIDLSKLSLQIDKNDNPAFKTILLRYFGTVNQPQIALMLSRFLNDSNKVVVLEALQALKRLPASFDASILLPFTESMSSVEQELTFTIIDKQADASLVPHLSAYLTGKSSEINDFFGKLIATHADKKNFEYFLKRLGIEDDWVQQQSIACLPKTTGCNNSQSPVCKNFPTKTCLM